MPSKEAASLAFSPKEIQLMAEFIAANGAKMDWSRIAAEVGYGSAASANVSFGNLKRKILQSTGAQPRSPAGGVAKGGAKAAHSTPKKATAARGKGAGAKVKQEDMPEDWEDGDADEEMVAKKEESDEGDVV